MFNVQGDIAVEFYVPIEELALSLHPPGPRFWFEICVFLLFESKAKFIYTHTPPPPSLPGGEHIGKYPPWEEYQLMSFGEKYEKWE
jgi:hypothetical protein